MGKLYLSGIVEPLTAPSTVSSVLNDNSWETISEVAQAGQAANYWSVGDTKTIVINGTVGATTFSNLSVDVFILGFDHNSSVEGTNTIHFKIGKIDGVQVGLCDANYLGASSISTDKKGWFRICTGGTSNNSGGWKSCSMRTTILGSDSTPEVPTSNSLLSALPSDLRAVMKAATKYSDNTGGGSDTASYVTSTTDYLFLLAEYEYIGGNGYANSAEQNYQAQYDYYKTGNSRVHYKHDEKTKSVYVWTRSTRRSNSADFVDITNNGAAAGTYATQCLGISPAFVV